MQIVETEKMPIKMWLDDIEDGAMEQIKNIANLPFVYKWVAVMPDSHQGYGMPIGGVVALDNVISPNMVGVDIGCGMCAINTGLKEITQDQLKEIMGGVREVVPVGFNKHQKGQDVGLMPSTMYPGLPSCGVVVKMEYENAMRSLGTLGGGNHFIEIQKSEFGHIWIMIHSGSRNLGKKVCDYYNDIAKDLNKKYYTPNVIEQDLAFLPVETEIGQAYIKEMQYCVDFAFSNRKLMMERVVAVFNQVMDGEVGTSEMINIAHNYASLENHMGKNVWVHRKGATSAKKGEMGIIPGSMGTKSYIVEGLGSRESFMSCSHGAGRKMSRSQASRELTLEEADKAMDGIIYGRWGKTRKGGLDFGEAPQAYKDISKVMENQKDLVKPIVELTPLAVIKG